MKKILSIICAMLLILSLGACSPQGLEGYLEENEENMISSLSGVFGTGAQIEARVEDNGFVFEVVAPELNADMNSPQREAIDRRVKALLPDEAELEKGRADNPQLKELENYTIILRDGKGRLIGEYSTHERPEEKKATDSQDSTNGL